MDELIALGPLLIPIVVSIAALISAIVPDDKMPKWAAMILNWLALNVGKAKNDPNVQ